MLSHRIQRDNLGILWDEELNEAWLENAIFVLKNLTRNIGWMRRRRLAPGLAKQTY